MKNSIFLSLLIVCAVTGTAQRTCITARTNGNWDQSSTWNLNRVPADNDSIVIPLGMQVTLAAGKKLSNVFLDIAGSLKMDEASMAGASNDLDIITNSNKTNLVVARVLDLDARIERGADRDGLARIRIRINNAGDFVTKFSTDLKLLQGSATAFNNASPSFLRNQNGSLTLVLMEFSVSNTDKSVQLKWKAQQENNNDLYIVERSGDAHTWQKINTLNAVPTASTAQQYSYSDQQPLNGISYYRLRVINKDGKFGFTPIKAVRIWQDVKDAILYPNPASSYTQIFFNERITGSLTVHLYGRSGELVKTWYSSDRSNVMELNVAGMPPGKYIVSIMGATDFRRNMPLLLIK